ncbi:IPT/TIG domain-containing protein [Paenibacillus sp. KQZ6P-2]|uniref:IPT/TIG domain-containing protein n=1 Tax=Paenibacillus mangrovi TaxID=2931978 RepID=A0A9X1WP17_9BACL|nr:IPT/TIG domain-containing protein [Paenibacillus mangrovi]MCJ8012747.1 IPT/TIG domain-containing protein [Paenibacillus mangrovi]
MKKIMKYFTLFMTVCLLIGGVFTPAPKVSAATIDYVNVTKTVNPSSITTEEQADVNLSILGTPPVNVVVPNDVVLIIDKSGSMLPQYNNGEDKMQNAKDAAKGFVDLMDFTKHRVAVVDFSSVELIKSLPFTTDKDVAKNYIDGIKANGATATGDAIDVAMKMLADHRPEAQPVIIIMTDGDATEPKNDPYGFAKSKAQEAKDAGIIFYTIALLKASDDPEKSGPNTLLKEMATTANHHHFVLGSVGLSEIYAAIVKEIGMASAFDVTVTDIVGPDFEIVPGSYDQNIPKPEVSGNVLTWKFNELKNSTLTFNYKIRPVSKTKTGNFPVSTSSSLISYKDYAGASRTKSIPGSNLTVKLPAPVITSITEPYGHPNGGESVTINGKNFMPGAVVQFGLNNATNVNVVDNNQITVTSPKGVQGLVDVTVKNPDGQKAVGQFQYKIDPIVTSLSPSNGPLAGGTTVVVQGNYLMKGLSVKFADQPATVSSYSNPTYLKVITPAGTAPGPVDVTFTNPDGTSVTIKNGFSYDTPPSTDPEIISISPNKGSITGGEISYLDGKNFKSGMKVLIGGKEATATLISPTRFKVTIPKGESPGTVDVSVVDLDGKSFVLANAYTYEPIVYPTPTIVSISPNTGLVAGGEVIYINGTNFVSNISKVYIGGNLAISTYVDSTRLKVTVPPSAAPGKVDVKVLNDTNEALEKEGYEYTLPVIVPVTVTSLTPNTGLASGGDIIYINGSNFKSGATVSFGSNSVGSTYVSSSRLKVTVPAAQQIGKVDITVTNPDGGTGTLADGYEYTKVLPVITSLSPSTGSKAGGDITYVDGKNFDSTASVTVNGVSAAVTFVNNTRLKVTIPPSSVVGDVPLVVTLSNGESASATFNYNNGPVLPSPTITSLTSTSESAGTIIYINGSNFTNKPKVFFGNVEATAVTYVNPTRVKVTVPSGNTGSVEVKVINPDGQASNTTMFTYK